MHILALLIPGLKRSHLCSSPPRTVVTVHGSQPGSKGWTQRCSANKAVSNQAVCFSILFFSASVINRSPYIPTNIPMVIPITCTLCAWIVHASHALTRSLWFLARYLIPTADLSHHPSLGLRVPQHAPIRATRCPYGPAGVYVRPTNRESHGPSSVPPRNAAWIALRSRL